MQVSEQWARHKQMVQETAKELQGTIFNCAPFDIMNEEGTIFYEVKSPSDRHGKHKGECRISISEDERKFGQVMRNRLVIIIVFNEVKYLIPFPDLEDRITRNRLNSSSFGGTERLKRQVTLGKKFLQKYAL
jgi:hypothetical protein